MAQAVTRVELEQVLDQRFEQFETKLDRRLDERFAIERRITDERFTRSDAKHDETTRILLNAIENMRVELGQHVRAIMEQLGANVGVVDDKYRDLPDRVSRLEDAVFTRR